MLRLCLPCCVFLAKDYVQIQSNGRRFNPRELFSSWSHWHWVVDQAEYLHSRCICRDRERKEVNNCACANVRIKSVRLLHSSCHLCKCLQLTSNYINTEMKIFLRIKIGINWKRRVELTCMNGTRYFPQKSMNFTFSTRLSKYTPVEERE